MKAIVVMLAVIVFASCNNNKKDPGDPPTGHDTVPPRQPSTLDFTDSSIIYNSSEFIHRRIMIDSVIYYVVEGDILMTDSAYFAYKMEMKFNHILGEVDSTVVYQWLIGKPGPAGKQIQWPKGDTLRYAITGFSGEEYKQIRENFLNAAREWSQTCNIHFKHIDTLDHKLILTPPPGLTFLIAKVKVGGGFIASAFFPDARNFNRCVFVDPNYFQTDYDKVGVFRHEIGHILGFLHEHIRAGAPAVCPDEFVGKPIEYGNYDPMSVMHYYCGGMGDIYLRLTEQDRRGALKVYGPPTK
jgi:hypothetical protein